METAEALALPDCLANDDQVKTSIDLDDRHYRYLFYGFGENTPLKPVPPYAGPEACSVSVHYFVFVTSPSQTGAPAVLHTPSTLSLFTYLNQLPSFIWWPCSLRSGSRFLRIPLPSPSPPSTPIKALQAWHCFYLKFTLLSEITLVVPTYCYYDSFFASGTPYINLASHSFRYTFLQHRCYSILEAVRFPKPAEFSLTLSCSSFDSTSPWQETYASPF